MVVSAGHPPKLEGRLRSLQCSDRLVCGCRRFNITGGVPQGRMVSPRLFFSMLHWAMREWKAEVGNTGFNLMDGSPNLLDLRLADNILVFGQSLVEAGNFLLRWLSTWIALACCQTRTKQWSLQSLQMRPNLPTRS